VFVAATVPVSAKMPLPIVAPMPTAISATGPSTRLSLPSAVDRLAVSRAHREELAEDCVHRREDTTVRP
jgi:hypothetical protein